MKVAKLINILLELEDHFDSDIYLAVDEEGNDILEIEGYSIEDEGVVLWP